MYRKYVQFDMMCKNCFLEGFMLIGYVRVSSDSDKQTTDLQKDALLQAGVDPHHLFEDRMSGSKDTRPGLERALAFLQPKDTLVVWKLDRLGRSLPHLLSIMKILKKREVAFRSITEGMDTSTISGELLFHVFGALAQFERALIQERIKAGIESARRRGKRGGRPPVLSKEKLASILSALEGNASKASVCRSFGVKRSTLANYLKKVKL